MGTRRRGISRSLLDVSDGAAGVGLDWNACSCIREARSTSGRPRNVQVCYGRWAQTPVRLGLDRRAGLSGLPRWGCDVLIFRGRA